MMQQVSAMNKWCTRPWIYFGLCITFLMTAIILCYWQEWSVELKIIAAVSALVPIHVVEEWVFPSGFHYQYNSFWHSDQLDRYPMCRLSDMYTNLIATFMYAGFTLYSVVEGEVPTGIIVGTIGFCALEIIIHTGIDTIEVSGNGTSRTGIKAGQNEGYFRAAAMSLAALVDVPVVLVGGLRSIEKINQYLNEPTNEARAEGKLACTMPCKEEEADRQTRIEYISLSRPLVREPNLIQRWQEGDTRPSLCVSCNTCYRTPGHQCIFNLRKK